MTLKLSKYHLQSLLTSTRQTLSLKIISICITYIFTDDGGEVEPQMTDTDLSLFYVTSNGYWGQTVTSISHSLLLDSVRSVQWSFKSVLSSLWNCQFYNMHHKLLIPAEILVVTYLS